MFLSFKFLIVLREKLFLYLQSSKIKEIIKSVFKKVFKDHSRKAYKLLVWYGAQKDKRMKNLNKMKMVHSHMDLTQLWQHSVHVFVNAVSKTKHLLSDIWLYVHIIGCNEFS